MDLTGADGDESVYESVTADRAHPLISLFVYLFLQAAHSSVSWRGLDAIQHPSRRKPVLEEERDLALLSIFTVFTSHINRLKHQCTYMDKAEVLYR